MKQSEAYERIERILSLEGRLIATTTGGPFKLTIDDIAQETKAEHIGMGAFRGFVRDEGKLGNEKIEIMFDSGGAMNRVEDADGHWIWSWTAVDWRGPHKEIVFEHLKVTPKEQNEILRELKEKL